MFMDKDSSRPIKTGKHGRPHLLGRKDLVTLQQKNLIIRVRYAEDVPSSPAFSGHALSLASFALRGVTTFICALLGASIA